MKRERISETVQNINLEYIEEALSFQKKQRYTFKAWYKVGLVAACVALVVTIGTLITGKLLLANEDKTVVDSVILIEYDNAYFEVIEDAKVISRYGLPRQITADMVGKRISYLKKEELNAVRCNYISSDAQTDDELLEYAPAAHKAVRIFKNGDRYYYTLFCNYLIEANESLPIEEGFSVYGIDTASDIISIAPVKGDNSWSRTGTEITNREAIAEFFEIINGLTVYSFDEYHEIIFDDEVKKYEVSGGDVGGEAYERVANDRKGIVIKSKEGLFFDIYYYPTYGWITVSETMSYYKMSPKLMEWFKSNIL